jgi:hypothetical protein
VSILNKETYFIEKYISKISQPLRTSIKSANTNGFLVGLTTSIIYYAVAAVYSLGAYLVQNNLYGMSLQNIMLVFGCILMGAQSVGKLFFQIKHK